MWQGKVQLRTLQHIWVILLATTCSLSFLDQLKELLRCKFFLGGYIPIKRDFNTLYNSIIDINYICESKIIQINLDDQIALNVYIQIMHKIKSNFIYKVKIIEHRKLILYDWITIY